MLIERILTSFVYFDCFQMQETLPWTRSLKLKGVNMNTQLKIQVPEEINYKDITCKIHLPCFIFLAKAYVFPAAWSSLALWTSFFLLSFSLVFRKRWGCSMDNL